MLDATPILLTLLSLPPYRGDVGEPPSAREARLRPYAVAIAEVSKNRHEAARLIAQGWHETKFAGHVLGGHCDLMPAGERCDGGHARGAWQLHEAACHAAYRFPAGSLESIHAEAVCAAGLLRTFSAAGAEHALTPDHAAFAGMGARAWTWPEADVRVKTMKRVEQKLSTFSGS